VYSKVYSRLDWFFDYIGEPEPEDEEFIPDLYGDVNFDGILNITDIIIMVNFILYPDLEDEYWTPTLEEFITADINQDGTLNILDVIQVVQEILGTTFRGAVEFLKENFPQLKVEERLSKLDKSIHFAR
jgi:hypothetical protein